MGAAMIDTAILGMCGGATTAIVGAAIYVVRLAINIGHTMRTVEVVVDAAKQVPGMVSDIAAIKESVRGIASKVEEHDDDLIRVRELQAEITGWRNARRNDA